MLFSSTLVSPFSNSLSWMHLVTHCYHLMALLVQTSLTTEPWFWAHAIRASTSWARWTEIHCHCSRLLITNLIASDAPVRVLSILRLVKLMLRSTMLVQILSATDACPVFNGCISMHLITKLETATVVVFSAAVASELSLAGGTIITHWNVLLTWNVASNRRNILHFSVSIWDVLHRLACLHVVWALLRISVRHWMLISLMFMVNLAQSSIKRVFVVLCHWLVDSSFVCISWLKALGDVLSISSIIALVDFLIISPPLWINHRVQTCRAGPLLFFHMRVLNLKSCLWSVFRHSAWELFRAVSAPRRRRFFDNLGALTVPVLFQILWDFISCWSIRWYATSATSLIWQGLSGESLSYLFSIINSDVLLTASFICTAWRPLALTRSSFVRSPLVVTFL